MIEQCKSCKNVGYDEHGGYFHTGVCDSCRHKVRFSMYIEKKGD
jgi:hypothetical protein